MRLHLVRHGHYALLDQALGGRDPHPLSQTGRAQAEAVGETLAGQAITTLITSPVQRAQETAAIIGARTGLSPLPDPVFSEIDFAGWTGQRFTDLQSDPAWHAWNQFRSTAGVPGGETMLAVQARAVAGVGHLAASYPDQSVALVSHADVIKAIIGHVLGAPLDLMHRFDIAPCSVSRIDWYGSGAKVLYVSA